MILYTLWSNIFIIRIIIIGNKKLDSIIDTESKIIHFMASNKYIIVNMKCWHVFKQDPIRPLANLQQNSIGNEMLFYYSHIILQDFVRDFIMKLMTL